MNFLLKKADILKISSLENNGWYRGKISMRRTGGIINDNIGLIAGNYIRPLDSIDVPNELRSRTNSSAHISSNPSSSYEINPASYGSYKSQSNENSPRKSPRKSNNEKEPLLANNNSTEEKTKQKSSCCVIV